MTSLESLIISVVSMSKPTKEDCKTISIYQFKKWGCLKGYSAGTVDWTNGWSGKKNNIGYKINTGSYGDEMYIQLEYTITDPWTGEKEDIKQRYPIVTTPCNYGDKRYWFKCSVFSKGVYCGRRVAKLYLGNGSYYFACRHCYNLSYDSRNRSFSYSFADIDEYESKLKRWHYRGKPTRKYKRNLKMIQKSERDMLMLLRKYKMK